MSMNRKAIAFGDIHGCPRAAESAVRLTQELGATGIFLGDYVDRGPDNIGVLDVLIRARAAEPDWVFLRGNHDQMLLDLIDGRDHPDGFDERTREEAYADWQAAPEPFRAEVVRFLTGTKHYHETEHHIFVHAPLMHDGLALHEKAPYDLVWNYDLEPVWQGKLFVHGHLPIREAEITPARINVNTSCGYNGILTGVLLDLGSGATLGICAIAEQGEVLSAPEH